jgi:hypothetical protein
MSNNDEFTPAWDPKKHDEQAEKNPPTKVINFICKCGINEFLPKHKVQLIIAGSKVHIAFSNPPDVMCIGCGASYTTENMLENLDHARKRSNLSAVKDPEKDS